MCQSSRDGCGCTLPNITTHGVQQAASPVNDVEHQTRRTITSSTNATSLLLKDQQLIGGQQLLGCSNQLSDFVTAVQRRFGTTESASSVESTSCQGSEVSYGAWEASPVVRSRNLLLRQRFQSQGSRPNTFALVEIFSSGSCSSSAKVEASLLEQLAKAPQADDPLVYPIVYHVDYWNDLGWADPFSLQSATRRQRWYQNRSTGSPHPLFTPQAIINGKQQLVGTKLGKVMSSPQPCGGRQLAHVDLVVREQRQGEVVMELNMKCSQRALGCFDPEQLVVVLVVVDEGTCCVHVSRGCNKGTCVQHVNIAASWRQMRVKHFHGECQGLMVKLHVPTDDIWSDQKAVVALLQDRRDGNVLGFCRKALAPGGSHDPLLKP